MDYTIITKHLEQKGVQLFGNEFKIPQNDSEIITKLSAYFLNDNETCNQLNINPNKGILLSGPIGCGKTTIMNLMKHITPHPNKFVVKPCREISLEFIQEGYSVIHKYTRGKLYETNAKTFCFDDLGLENNLKYFGNDCNVMGEILLSRYDLFISKNIKTHLTTNLSASEIEANYGSRVRSRMRSMFNLIAYEKTTTDKR